jgi:ankyrin repeat protein
LGNIFDNGATVLHYACSYGHTQTVEALLKEYPQFLDMTRIDGSTPLHEASWNGHTQTVRVLLKIAPWLVDMQKSDGSTAFSYANLKGHDEIVSVILELKNSLITTTLESLTLTPPSRPNSRKKKPVRRVK